MRVVCARLTRGEDLYEGIRRLALENHIRAGAIVSAVGCVKRMRIRLAGGSQYLEREEMCEISAVTGTVSTARLHIHIALADREGAVVGGHLREGTIINTTCEIVILAFDEYEFAGAFDPNTGYNELDIRRAEAWTKKTE